MREVEEPYEVWKTADGSWEWRVLKKWQLDDDKPYARWFCAVKSPFTFGRFELGDVYVSSIKKNAQKVSPSLISCDHEVEALIEKVETKTGIPKGNKLQLHLNKLGYKTDGEDWDEPIKEEEQ